MHLISEVETIAALDIKYVNTCCDIMHLLCSDVEIIASLDIKYVNIPSVKTCISCSEVETIAALEIKYVNTCCDNMHLSCSDVETIAAQGCNGLNITINPCELPQAVRMQKNDMAVVTNS